MYNKKQKIAILGSTGSIGVQSLEIIKQKPSLFSAHLLTCNKNYMLLYRQALDFNPKYIVINCEEGYRFLSKNLNKEKTIVLLGEDSLCKLIEELDCDLVLTAVVGRAGLLPTIAAIKSGKKIALANKETLVIAGELIMSLAKEYNAPIIPVDSEHSAILQCLVGEKNKNISKLILTASGGPFLNCSKSDFKNIRVEDALKHPNWSMGNKITIDSATLMNKGFELIEAYWLFGVHEKKIDIVIHPQSIIHSLVEFIDGSIKAQLGLPSMTIPILYALSYPDRINYPIEDFDLAKIQSLTFLNPDKTRFPHLRLAYECLAKGGTYACSLNAANEIAVDAFLNKQISFLGMIRVVEKSLEKSIFVQNPKIEDYLCVDFETRKIATQLIYKK
ncbi:MAG: 1-deoxy-D-xylulose-5-phosphate reductoisomerase [Flavobacteriales bacterium]|nr:1-deoxy-D-xylulose-5-phosphate reductoisomerase [Flavobacteriales bacterium]|tara:strand:- start:9062 stop:10228 length:1167 start_codon:yes stop_codon:yes gene_type:complete